MTQRCHHVALVLAGVILLLAGIARGGDSSYPIESGFPDADAASAAYAASDLRRAIEAYK